jgi:hypothetical protein
MFRNKTSAIIQILFLVCLYLLINYDLLYQFIFNSVIPGWDGSAHLAIGKIYADNIFPMSWGWVENWYLGMPFPQFYPPLFYFCVALLSKILFFMDYELVFRIFVLLNVIVTPYLYFLLSKAYFKDNKKAFISALILVIFLSFRGPNSNFGISFSSVVQVGLYAQSLAFNLFLLWIYFILFKEKKSKLPIIAPILFSLIILSNVHVLIPASLFFVILFIYSLEKGKLLSVFKKFLYQGLISTGLAAFWLIPMVINYPYLVTKALSTPYNLLILNSINFYYIPVFCVLVYFLTTRNNKDKPIRLVSSFLLVLIFICTTGIFIPESIPAPLHFVRWFSIILYLSPIIITFVMFRIEDYFSRTETTIIVYLLVIFLILVSILQIFKYRFDDGIYKNENIIQYLDTSLDVLSKEDQPLLLVEFSAPDTTQMSFFIDSYIGMNNIPTVFSNIRESSLNSLYLTSLRNLFSDNKESWGTQSFIALNKDFQNQKWENKLSLARYFGVTNILLISDEIKDNVFLKENTILSDKNEIYEIRKIIDPSPRSVSVKVRPISFIGDNGFKNRYYYETTFSRLGEIWMENLDKDILFIKNHSNELNDITIDFSQAVILANNPAGQIKLLENEENVNDILSSGKIIYYDESLKKENIIMKYQDTYPEQMISYDYDNPNLLYKTVAKNLNKEEYQNLNLILSKTTYFPSLEHKEDYVGLASPAFTVIETESYDSNYLMIKNEKYLIFSIFLSLTILFMLIFIIWKSKK